MIKLKILQHLSGNKVYEIGSVYFAKSKIEAARLIRKGIAELEDKKAQEKLLKEAEKLEKKAAEEEAKKQAILRAEQIKKELRELYEQVVLKEAELAGVVLDDEQKAKLIDELEKRNSGNKG